MGNCCRSSKVQESSKLNAQKQEKYHSVDQYELSVGDAATDSSCEDNEDYTIPYSETKVTCGASWDFVGKEVDLDITAVAMDTYSIEMDAAFYNNLTILNGAITHSGDNKTGISKFSNDDEQIVINLQDLPSQTQSIWFILNIYNSTNSTFSELENCIFSLYNTKNEKQHTYPINANNSLHANHTALLLGVLYKDENEMDWRYKLIEKSGNGSNFVESKYLLIKHLRLAYSKKILLERPSDCHKKYDLKKDEYYTIDPKISRVTVGLGWDPDEHSECDSIDVDASIICFRSKMKGQTKEVVDLEMKSIVYYGNLKYYSFVIHRGDNLTGAGEGDDEQIDIYLDELKRNKQIDMLCVVINIYSGAKSFESIHNCFARLTDENGTELCRFQLTKCFDTRGVVMCSLQRRENGCWALLAIGTGCPGKKASDSLDYVKKICLGLPLDEDCSCCNIM